MLYSYYLINLYFLTSNRAAICQRSNLSAQRSISAAVFYRTRVQNYKKFLTFANFSAYCRILLAKSGLFCLFSAAEPFPIHFRSASVPFLFRFRSIFDPLSDLYRIPMQLIYTMYISRDFGSGLCKRRKNITARRNTWHDFCCDLLVSSTCLQATIKAKK